MAEKAPPGGIFGSVRGLLSTLIEALAVRLELFATELEEEQLRLLRVIGFGAAAFFLLAAGALLLAMFLIVLLWDDHRLLVLGILTAVFLGGGGIAFGAARRAARRTSPLFAASLGELRRDRDELDGQERQA
jgi:uncharacterized membrane protein YqjE